MSIERITDEEAEEKILKLEYRLAQIEQVEACQNEFLSFVRSMWPEFIAGRHHRIMAEKLERVAKGELKRLIINMPPRHTKSEFASFLFPAWMIGKNPAMKIIQATHTTELAVNFGRKVKNLLEREDYLEIFPDAALSADSKASGRWDTARGGMYYGVGVGSNLAGRGGDLIIIDDPHSEQTAMSLNGFDDAWEWYTGGPRQRLQPGGAIIVVMTRWSEKDLTGQLIRAQARDSLADNWEVIEFPMEMPSGKPLWPQFWSFEEMQVAALILLDAKKGRWDFPELKQMAMEAYKFWEPETVIIEAKASGMPLTHELRNMGIPVVNFTPSRGNDKVSRVHSVSTLFESGMIWAPDESWAHEVIEECAAFPNGEHDDLVDSTTQALMRYRQGNFIQLPSDYWEDEGASLKVQQYYG
jgi:predicted phage terminase large subunit-like protein